MEGDNANNNLNQPPVQNDNQNPDLQPQNPNQIQNPNPQPQNANQIQNPEPAFFVPTVDDLLENSIVWDTQYINNKEVWSGVTTGSLGKKFRVWGKNFDYYDIHIDAEGKVTKTLVKNYKDIAECLAIHSNHDFLQFFLNHVCDFNTINDLRKSLT